MNKPLRVRYPRINRLVDDLLNDHHVSKPPVPVDKIAESCGFEISYKRLQDDLAGFLLRKEERKVIGVNASHSKHRRRFTIAHECGHALLHEGEELHVDHSFKINLRSTLSATATDIEEIEANAFAAALLMPEKLLRRELATAGIDVQDDEEIRRLAKLYDVSPQSMSFRVLNLLSRPW